MLTAEKIPGGRCPQQDPALVWQPALTATAGTPQFLPCIKICQQPWAELLYEPQGNLPALYHCRSHAAATPHYGKENQKLHSAILNGRYLISLLIFFTVLKVDASITAAFIKSSWQAQNCLPWRKLATRAWRKIKISMAFHLNPERSP